MLFVWVISVALTVLAILNAALSEGVFGVIGVSLGGGVLYTFYAVALAIAIDALLALFIRRVLPGKWFNHKKAAFTVGAGEKNFYETIKIRKWKDKIPETGGLLVGFSKSAVADRHDNTYLLKFLKETCYAELMHIISIPCGFLVLLLTLAWDSIPHFIAWFGLPVAIVNAVLQLLPIFVQRYVRPFLLSAYRYNETHPRHRSLRDG